MTKIFSKTRICVIDCYPAFEFALNQARNFAKKHYISLNSSDGKRLILDFCIKQIVHTYKNTKSQYPKVLCMSNASNNHKIKNFIDNHFDKMMERLPAPYCGKYDLTSPDLELAAENSLKQTKPKHRFQQFIKNLNLSNVD